MDFMLNFEGARSIIANMTPPIYVNGRVAREQMDDTFTEMRDMSLQEIETFVQAALVTP